MTISAHAEAAPAFDRSAAVTRSLLGYAPLAGSVYLASGLTQALTREGFDLSRHSLSLLANGPLGWIHITTFIVTGLMTVAGAVGVRRALRSGRGGRLGSGLLVGYGVSLIAAGAFVADPMDGFPVGTPAGPPREVTLSGVLHLAAGGVGFACLIGATLVLAGHFARESRDGWAWYSRITGLVVLAGFVGVSSGSTSPAAVLLLWIGVVAGWLWLGAVGVHLYRCTPRPDGC